jgi:hypothetical protein
MALELCLHACYIPNGLLLPRDLSLFLFHEQTSIGFVTVFSSLACSEEDENDGGAVAARKAAHNEDELEKIQLERLQRRLEQAESKEQMDYREEFFELLDEVDATLSECFTHFT